MTPDTTPDTTPAPGTLPVPAFAPCLRTDTPAAEPYDPATFGTVAGAFTGVPSAVYHALRAPSAHTLEHVRRSPAHFLHALNTPTSPTPAMSFGTQFHTLVLEPEHAGGIVTLSPGVSSRTKAYADAVAEYGPDNVRTWDDADAHRAMVEAVRGNVLASTLLGTLDDTPVRHDNAFTELTCLVNADTPYGTIPLRSRIDRVWRGFDADIIRAAIDRAVDAGGERKETPIVVDLKTTRNAEMGAFARDAANLGYFRQLRVYAVAAAQAIGWCDPGDVDAYVVAVEKEPPYGVAVYRIAWTVGIGVQVRAMLERVGYAVASNEWTGYATAAPSVLEPPPWA